VTNAATYLDAEGLSRRDLLKRGLIGGGLVAAGLATPGLTGVAQAKGGKSINLHVTVNFALIQDPDTAGGSFYVPGMIYTAGPGNTPGVEIGVFHCWGFQVDAVLGVVNQLFDLENRGQIVITGTESAADARAVTGGTGDFANARGEGVPDLAGFLLVPTFFRIAFNLTGASGPPIG
jgi:hypothetical protein